MNQILHHKQPSLESESDIHARLVGVKTKSKGHIFVIQICVHVHTHNSIALKVHGKLATRITGTNAIHSDCFWNFVNNF